MTGEELIKLGSRRVRDSSDLTAIYIRLFADNFGTTPSCVPCTFDSDFRRLEVFLTNPKNKDIIMSNKNKPAYTLLRVNYEIISYKNNDTGATHRIYDNAITPEFAKEFLTNGSEEELEQRKKLFRPESLIKIEETPEDKKAEKVKKAAEAKAAKAEAKLKSEAEAKEKAEAEAKLKAEAEAKEAVKTELFEEEEEEEDEFEGVYDDENE